MTFAVGFESKSSDSMGLAASFKSMFAVALVKSACSLFVIVHDRGDVLFGAIGGVIIDACLDTMESCFWCLACCTFCNTVLAPRAMREETCLKLEETSLMAGDTAWRASWTTGGAGFNSPSTRVL